MCSNFSKILLISVLNLNVWSGHNGHMTSLDGVEEPSSKRIVSTSSSSTAANLSTSPSEVMLKDIPLEVLSEIVSYFYNPYSSNNFTIIDSNTTENLNWIKNIDIQELVKLKPVNKFFNEAVQKYLREVFKGESFIPMDIYNKKLSNKSIQTKPFFYELRNAQSKINLTVEKGPRLFSRGKYFYEIISFSKKMNICQVYDHRIDGAMKSIPLKKLDISKGKINTHETNFLSYNIRFNPSLEEVTFNVNSIENAKELSKSIACNPSLKKISFYKNIFEKNRDDSISDEDVKFFSQAIAYNKSIEKVIFYNSAISSLGAKYIARAISINQSLKELNLKCNNIKDDGAEYLSEVIKTSKNLQTLNLSCNQIDDDGAEYLSEGIKESKVLKTLDLRYNQIGDDGAKYLSEAIKLSVCLEFLDISENMIGDDGAKCLSEALKENKILQSLNLSVNEFGDKGADFLLEAIQTNNSLKFLDISENRTTEEKDDDMEDAFEEFKQKNPDSLVKVRL